MIDALCNAIRCGSTTKEALKFLGVEKAAYMKWRRRRGEIFDTMRANVREAVGYRQEKLMTELAQQNPAAALKHLGTAIDSPDHERVLASRQRDWQKLGLKPREELFCLRLLELGGQNPAEAVKRTGLWDAKTKGSIANVASKLMKKKNIQKRLEQLLGAEIGKLARSQRFKVTGRRIIEEYAAVGYARVERVTVPEKLQALDKLAVIAGLVKDQMPATGGSAVAHVQVLLPDNGRDPQFALPTNGQHAVTPPTAVIDFPERDDRMEPEPNGKPEEDNPIERELGLG